VTSNDVVAQGPRGDARRGGPVVSDQEQGSRHPWIWAALYFPFGLTFGFPAIALGYLASRAGVPVSAIAGVVGMSWLASGWKFVWAPLGDYTLSRKRWYRIAIACVSVGFVAMASVPLRAGTMPLLALLVLLTSVAGTFIAFATEGLMTHNTPPALRGRAGGWFQSGNQFAQTAGGGLGLWLMGHVPSPWMAGAALAAILWLCSLALTGLEEPPRALHGASAVSRATDAWRELAALVRSRAGRIGLILAILPIGTGAAQSLFGSLAPEWHAPADTVSAVLGLGGGLAIVLGCFVGGRLADAITKTTSYAISCALAVVACAVIAWSPRTSAGYAISTLFYTFTLGMAAATMTAFVLAIIGDTAAATKINLFFALNTLFSLGMLRVDGWAHDAWRSNGMLYTEAVVGVAALLLFVVLAKRVRGTELPGESAAPAT
jgi:MFS transporter, PAT family, beta-lactamase induction signal transducer AmpG